MGLDRPDEICHMDERTVGAVEGLQRLNRWVRILRFFPIFVYNNARYRE